MTEKLFADDPILNKNEDKLERNLFSEQVSEVCKNVAGESSSSVVALVGPWGSGKSSILNLVAKNLKKDKWSVAEFNPWLLSDVESLLKSFFDEVINAIPTNKDNHDDLRKKIGGYAKAISPLGKIGGLFGIDGSSAINRIGDLIQGDQSLTKKRDDLIKELKKLKKPILVILDDLDRLYPEELLMIFKIVRLVGRLPNLHYLLSYDEKTLLDIIAQTDLSKNDITRARNYLEKMVQVKLDLPKMNSAQQLRLVNVAHDEVLRRNKITTNEDDTKRLSNAYAECMIDYLNQPRAIKRFFAQVDALYPLVNGEVNFSDFTLLTFLRTFEPNIYQLIIDSKQELTGKDFATNYHDEGLENRCSRWMKIISETTETKNVEKIFNLLSHLFIYIKSARNKANYSDDHKDEQLHKRVGNIDYFDRYFVFGVPEDDISDSKITELTSKLSLGDTKSAKEISRLINKDAVLALRKMRNIQTISGISPIPLIGLLAKKYIYLKGENAFFSVPPEWAINDMIKKAVSSVEISERKSLFKATCSTLSGLLMIIGTFAWINEEKEEVIADELRQTMIDALKKQMKKIANKEYDQFTENDYKLFYPFKMLVGSNELTDWLWEGVNNKSWDPIDILANLVSEATSYGSDGAKKTIGQLDNDTLENYFGLGKLLLFRKNEIEALVIDNRSSFHNEEPTFENKRNYVLRLLKNRYDNQNKKTED